MSGFTFGFILFPAVVVGVLLGWAEHLRTTGGRPGWRWLALSPLALAVSAGALGVSLLGMAVSAGALGVSLLGMAGGFALSRRGPVWARLACGLVAMAVVPVWALIATTVGGPRLALDSPRGLWVALYLYSFVAVLALACAIPHRAVLVSAGPPSPPAPDAVDQLSGPGARHPLP